MKLHLNSTTFSFLYNYEELLELADHLEDVGLDQELEIHVFESDFLDGVLEGLVV
jgi:hypothetical protein